MQTRLPMQKYHKPLLHHFHVWCNGWFSFIFLLSWIFWLSLLWNILVVPHIDITSANNHRSWKSKTTNSPVNGILFSPLLRHLISNFLWKYFQTAIEDNSCWNIIPCTMFSCMFVCYIRLLTAKASKFSL